MHIIIYILTCDIRKTCTLMCCYSNEIEHSTVEHVKCGCLFNSELQNSVSSVWDIYRQKPGIILTLRFCILINFLYS